jgi:iron-sulfur cluster repair protein YtfE (RIC family)
MQLIDVLSKDHELLRSALKTLELHLGPASGYGWEDRVKVDLAKFRKDLNALLNALRAHEVLEAKLAARWRQKPPTDEALKMLLLARHSSIDSLLKLFTTASTLIVDGHVHATRTILSRLQDELTRHMDEEERDVFPPLRARQDARS